MLASSEDGPANTTRDPTKIYPNLLAELGSDEDYKIVKPSANYAWGKPDVDLTDNNFEEVDKLPDCLVEICPVYRDDNSINVLMAAPEVKSPTKPARPKYRAGFPDYACPAQVVEHIDVSVPNKSPVQPAGVRVGDLPTPAKFEVRDQARFQLGHFILNDAQNNPQVVHARGNTGDQFVVTGQLPGLKGIKSSYMSKFLSFPFPVHNLTSLSQRTRLRRPAACARGSPGSASCLSTATMVPARGGIIGSVRNGKTSDFPVMLVTLMFSATESLANLPPHCICPHCYKVPLALFLTPPVRHRITQRVVTAGFRR